MKTANCATVMAIGVVLAIGTMAAAEDSWWSGLNPFSNASASSQTSTVGRNSGGVTVPRFDNSPGQSGRSMRRHSEPSMWNKFTSGTKSAFNKTTDFLNPFSESKKKTASSVMDRFKPASKPQKRTEKKSSFFSGWGRDDPPSEPSSVADFLSLPRPEY